MSRLFTDSSNRIDTGLATNSALRSYHVWCRRQGDGGNGNGRVWDKNTSDILTNNNSVVQFFRNWSGALAQYSITAPSTGVWTPIGVSYDSGASSNVPVMYTDGVSRSVTTVTAASGSVTNASDNFFLGNRTGADRGLDGALCEWAVWDEILNANEFAALARGVSPRYIRPGSIIAWMPVFGLQSPEPDMIRRVTGTVTGSTFANHAPVTLFTKKPNGFPLVEESGGGGGSAFPHYYYQLLKRGKNAR